MRRREDGHRAKEKKEEERDPASKTTGHLREQTDRAPNAQRPSPRLAPCRYVLTPLNEHPTGRHPTAACRRGRPRPTRSASTERVPQPAAQLAEPVRNHAQARLKAAIRKQNAQPDWKPVRARQDILTYFLPHLSW
nr:hypothetical protein Iba_chr12bCG9490 [Ipomoea batatas]